MLVDCFQLLSSPACAACVRRAGSRRGDNGTNLGMLGIGFLTLRRQSLRLRARAPERTVLRRLALAADQRAASSCCLCPSCLVPSLATLQSVPVRLTVRSFSFDAMPDLTPPVFAESRDAREHGPLRAIEKKWTNLGILASGMLLMRRALVGRRLVAVLVGCLLREQRQLPICLKKATTKLTLEASRSFDMARWPAPAGKFGEGESGSRTACGSIWRSIEARTHVVGARRVSVSA